MRCGPTPAASAITAREKCAFLSDPESYPERPRAVEILETHFAWVFLTDRHVFKMKKAVRRGTMDYATLAARERNCRNELELNRRLAPSVYLEVLPLSLAGGRLVLGPGEETVEWLVRMRRLPEDRQLDHAIAKGTVTASDLDEVIALLAEFYRNTHREPMTPDAWLERVHAQALSKARELAAPDLELPQDVATALCDAQLAFVSEARALLAPRAARLVDGHGDLRPEHVFLGPGACVIDCLEFDSDLRRLDPAEEIAYLALGCRRLGREDLAAALLAGYRAALEDPVPDALLAFYASRRGTVAALLAAWHVRDPMYPDRRPWIERACAALDEALRDARGALRALADARSSGVGRQRPAIE